MKRILSDVELVIEIYRVLLCYFMRTMTLVCNLKRRRVFRILVTADFFDILLCEYNFNACFSKTL